jgi:hypothetical protein
VHRASVCEALATGNGGPGFNVAADGRSEVNYKGAVMGWLVAARSVAGVQLCEGSATGTVAEAAQSAPRISL